VLNLLLKILWAAVALLAMWFILDGLLANVYFENTGEAIAEAHRGQRVVLLGSVALSLVALASFRLLRQPKAVGLALLAPVVICGGLLLIAPETLFPQIAVAVAFPIALGGLLVGLVWAKPRDEQRRTSESPGGSDVRHSA
jgi:hypothetical protein